MRIFPNQKQVRKWKPNTHKTQIFHLTKII